MGDKSDSQLCCCVSKSVTHQGKERATLHFPPPCCQTHSDSLQCFTLFAFVWPRGFLLLLFKGQVNIFPWLSFHCSVSFFLKHVFTSQNRVKKNWTLLQCFSVFEVLFWSFTAHSLSALIPFDAKHRLCNNLIWPQLPFQTCKSVSQSLSYKLLEA